MKAVATALTMPTTIAAPNDTFQVQKYEIKSTPKEATQRMPAIGSKPCTAGQLSLASFSKLLSLSSASFALSYPCSQPSECTNQRNLVRYFWGSDKRSEEHTSEIQSLMRISYAVFCLKKKKKNNTHTPK